MEMRHRTADNATTTVSACTASNESDCWGPSAEAIIIAARVLLSTAVPSLAPSCDSLAASRVRATASALSALEVVIVATTRILAATTVVAMSDASIPIKEANRLRNTSSLKEEIVASNVYSTDTVGRLGDAEGLEDSVCGDGSGGL